MKLETIELKQLYENEYDRWLDEMIGFLRNRQLIQLDLENLIEELEALGRSEKSAVKSLALQTIIHLLLYQFWDSERKRNENHWAGEIITFRVQLEDRLTTNLRNYLASQLNSIYENARLIAQKKTNLNSLPEQCPYSLEEILDKQWFPEL
jgi:type II secretory pathway component PulK